MEIRDTINELFAPTFEAIGDSDMSYSQKRALLYNLYCFACAVCPDYAAAPDNTLFEYGCCFLIEPERHPDYTADAPEFKHAAASADFLPGGGRWYRRRDEYFIKYDYSSPLYGKLVTSGVIPTMDRQPIERISLYAAVYCACAMFEPLRPLWFTYYFYLDATNEPVDEEFDEKLFELLHSENVYKEACELRGSALIGDEAELDGARKLLLWYKPFIALRREYIFDVFEKRMAKGDFDFVCEYSSAMHAYYPESVQVMNWNAAARSERVAKTRDKRELRDLVADLREYAAAGSSPVIDKYLKLAETMLKAVSG